MCYRINANEQMGGIKTKSTGSFAFFSPRPHSVHFPRRYSFSPRSTWEPVCRPGERRHKPLCVKKTFNTCRMSERGMRFRFWPSESRVSEVLREVVLCAWPGDELRFSVEVSETFSLILTFIRIFFLYLVGRRINWFNGNVHCLTQQAISTFINGWFTRYGAQRTIFSVVT